MMSYIPAAEFTALYGQILMNCTAGNAAHNMNSELQTEGMAIIRYRLKALSACRAWKAVFRRQQSAVFIHIKRIKIIIIIIFSLRLIPLNIANHIFPAKPLQIFCHIIRIFNQTALCYRRTEAIPAVPAHRSCFCRLFVHKTTPFRTNI